MPLQSTKYVLPICIIITVVYGRNLEQEYVSDILC